MLLTWPGMSLGLNVLGFVQFLFMSLYPLLTPLLRSQRVSMDVNSAHTLGDMTA